MSAIVLAVQLARRGSTVSLYNQFYQPILSKLLYKNSNTSPGALFYGKRGRSYQQQRYDNLFYINVKCHKFLYLCACNQFIR